jgi:hypothetical protein
MIDQRPKLPTTGAEDKDQEYGKKEKKMQLYFITEAISIIYFYSGQ